MLSAKKYGIAKEDKLGVYTEIHSSDTLVCDSFKTERQLCRFFVDNIKSFCHEILGDRYVRHEVEYAHEKKLHSRRQIRADLVIWCEKSIYIIELKNPKSSFDCREGIGQILSYGLWFPDSKKELLLISTKFDVKTAKIIKKYNLPIRFFYIQDDIIGEFIDERS